MTTPHHPLQCVSPMSTFFPQRNRRAVWLSLLASLLLLQSLLMSSARADEASEQTFVPEVVQTEFDELYLRLQADHFNLYVHRPKAEYDALYRHMRASFTRPLNLIQMQKQFQRFVAFGKVAHARIDALQANYGVYRQNGGKALPLALRIVDGIAYVAQNNSGVASIAAGDVILSLNGTPMKQILNNLGTQVSADNDYLLHTLLELYFPALLWQQDGVQDHYVMSFQHGTGQAFELTVPTRSRAEMLTAMALQPKQLELDWDQREAHVMADDVAYLRPGPFYNNDANATDIWDNSAFKTFLDKSFQDFQQAGVKKLIIDLRDNPGGDNSFSDCLLSWFANKPFHFASDFQIRVSPDTTASNRARLTQTAANESHSGNDISKEFDELYQHSKNGEIVHYKIPMMAARSDKSFQGSVFILINRRSYSNNVMVAAMAQDYGFAKIIGEETSDLASTYGAMEQFTLKRSGIVVGYPKAHIIRPNGKTESRGVIPDIKIKTPIIETPDDPVLQEVVKRVKK